MVFYIYITTLLFVFINELCAEEIILPDGRLFNVPKQDNYSYILKDESPSSLERLYIISEQRFDTALLCPKDYSILEMTQELVMNKSFNDLLSEDIDTFHAASLLRPEESGKYRMPMCPTLYDCLGYQACLFPQSYKLCYQNQVHVLHCTLLLTITCFRDDFRFISAKFQKQKDLVLHMHNKLSYSHGNIPLASETKVIHTELPEKAVFSGKCSTQKVAREVEGFYGNCSKLAIPKSVVTQHLWIHFARTFSENCRNKLQQVYCAFQYNKEGFCLPPAFHNQNKKDNRIFSLQALPETGPRPRTDGYKKFLLEHDPFLTPARLAFVILVNNETQAVMDLIHTIYRKQFLYVIHVDRRATTVREDLMRMVVESNLPLHNVFILPLERSFSTMPISYETVRAQLEGFEELLRLGVWDFVINLSDADMVFRSVDDLAIALAPHRGMSFLSSLKKKTIKKEIGISSYLDENAFCSCDQYVHNLTSKSFVPVEGFQIFHTSNGGTFSRQFIEYLIEEKLRSDVINKFQFYLQTDELSEESYIPTVIMNSPFKDSLHIASIHTNIDLIRSVCDSLLEDYGSLPDQLDSNEIFQLSCLSHGSFFVPKNTMQISDEVQKFAVEFSKEEYYKFIEKYLPPVIIRKLVDNAIDYLCHVSKCPKGKLVFESVLDVHVAPSFVSRIPCCKSTLSTSYQHFGEYNYWFDVSLFNKTSGRNAIARIMLQPSIYNTHCYGTADLRMVTILPWKTFEDPSVLSGWFVSKHSLPFPYGPANIDDISISLLLDTESEKRDCMFNDEYEGKPLTFEGKSFVKIELQLIDPNQQVRCVENNSLLWKQGEFTQTFKISCKNMESGFWKLLLKQIEPSKSRVYSIPFYLLDIQNADILQKELNNITHLWTVKNIAITSQNYTYNIQEQEKYEIADVSLRRHSVSPQANIYDLEYNRNEIMYFLIRSGKATQFFICSGGFASTVLLLLAVIWFCSWRYRFIQNLVLLSMFSLVLSVLLQIILFLSLCG